MCVCVDGQTGHQRAVTSLFFNLLEDQVVTTSIDKSVRFWNVDTGRHGAARHPPLNSPPKLSPSLPDTLPMVRCVFR